MAPEALPGWGGLCSHHEHNPWEMAQGLITSHQPADLSWIPLGCLGRREPSLPWAKAATAVMLVQSTEPQAAQEQEERTMPHLNTLLQAPKHVMEQKKIALFPRKHRELSTFPRTGHPSAKEEAQALGLLSVTSLLSREELTLRAAGLKSQLSGNAQ